MNGITATRLSFDDLRGWSGADHAAALRAMMASLPFARPSKALSVERADWTETGSALSLDTDPRRAMEAAFAPVVASDERRPLFTAYYEPEIEASRVRCERFRHPLHGRPPDLDDAPYAPRDKIVDGALAGRGLELFWLADPVEVFFLHIQGSGRLRFADGGVARVGYAGKNNRHYVAIGRLLVERGALSLREAHAEGIKAWLRAQPDGGAAIMNENPSYVFFEEKTGLEDRDGPIGALGVPLQAHLSTAVDATVHPLGCLLWIEADDAPDYSGRLLVAQDVGGAIKGAQRADLFFGSGAEMGAAAGRVRSRGRMVTLIPRSAADRLGRSA